MKIVDYNGEKIYIDDTPVDESETDIIDPIIDLGNLDKTIELEPINESLLLDDTQVDIWDGHYE